MGMESKGRESLDEQARIAIERARKGLGIAEAPRAMSASEALEWLARACEQAGARQAELLDQMERMKAQALIDEVTGVWNQRGFEERLEAEVGEMSRHQEPLSVALVEAEGLKLLDATMGLGAADYALARLAAAIKRAARDYDTVGRVAEGRFALVFPRAGIEGAQSACERILGGLRGTQLEWDGQAFGLPLNFGLAQMEMSFGGGPQKPSARALAARAAAALEKAKRLGADRWATSESLEEPK